MLGCVSLILPVYNAECCVRSTAEKASQVLESTGIPRYEIIVVDDGSGDHTFREALRARIGPHGKLIVARYGRNRGKGYALALGSLLARCPYVAFLDGDGDVDPAQLLYVLAPLHRYDAVVTSKWHPQSRTSATRLRRLLSHGFRALVWLLTGLRLRDTQTGAKAFKRKPLIQALKSVRTRRYTFDVELLATMVRQGARILEVPSMAPIRLQGYQGPRTIASMLLELLGIAYRLRAG
jgi:glycosyltransferase involved in cell wall biosynthesis